LDQITSIIREQLPTSPIVLHALLRAALVGSGRAVFSLFPTDPEVRLANARAIIAQEAQGFTKALQCYAQFTHLVNLRPETQDVDNALRQSAAIQDGHRRLGDGALMQGAVKVIAAGLAATNSSANVNLKVWEEHTDWLWNTYSGAAHTHAWPRLLPGFSQDRRMPGDFPGDLYMIATTTHIAMRSLESRFRPGSAQSTQSVLK
jgi:hypothetical protein